MPKPDLPIFTWQPPACKVIPFPAKKRVGKIRRTAEVLSGRSGKDAERYWQQVAGGMESQMRTAGIDECTIQSEISAFRDAVSRQMHGYNIQPGGAA